MKKIPDREATIARLTREMAIRQVHPERETIGVGKVGYGDVTSWARGTSFHPYSPNFRKYKRDSVHDSVLPEPAKVTANPITSKEPMREILALPHDPKSCCMIGLVETEKQPVDRAKKRAESASFMDAVFKRLANPRVKRVIKEVADISLHEINEMRKAGKLTERIGARSET